MIKLLHYLSLVTILFCVVGCGQKGALYLPDQSAPKKEQRQW